MVNLIIQSRHRNSAAMWPLLLLCAVIPGSGGVPLSCPPDTICLQDYNKERFHRLNIECRELTVILREDGDFFGRNVSYDGVRRCLTWRDGILSDCAVTDIDENGRRTDLSITYLCTAVFQTSTTPSPSPSDQTATAAPSSRHCCSMAAAIGAVVISVSIWILYRKCIQDPQKTAETLPP